MSNASDLWQVLIGSRSIPRVGAIPPKHQHRALHVPPSSVVRRCLRAGGSTVCPDRQAASGPGQFHESLVAEAQSDPEFAEAFRDRWLHPRRDGVRRTLWTAIKEGSLRRNIDIDAAIDLLYGSLYYRLLFGSGTLDECFVARAFRQFVTGHGTSSLVSMENAATQAERLKYASCPALLRSELGNARAVLTTGLRYLRSTQITSLDSFPVQSRNAGASWFQISAKAAM